MSCCSTGRSENSSNNSSKSCCCQDQAKSSCESPQLCCRPFYPMKAGPRPIKTVVYLRPNGSHPPCCPMPCPPKAIVTTFPGRSEEAPPPPAPKKCVVCTVKRIPVLPPPPPTPPVYSPCRPYVAPCSTN